MLSKTLKANVWTAARSILDRPLAQDEALVIPDVLTDLYNVEMNLVCRPRLSCNVGAVALRRRGLTVSYFLIQNPISNPPLEIVVNARWRAH